MAPPRRAPWSASHAATRWNDVQLDSLARETSIRTGANGRLRNDLARVSAHRQRAAAFGTRSRCIGLHARVQKPGAWLFSLGRWVWGRLSPWWQGRLRTWGASISRAWRRASFVEQLLVCIGVVALIVSGLALVSEAPNDYLPRVGGARRDARRDRRPRRHAPNRQEPPGCTQDDKPDGSGRCSEAARWDGLDVLFFEHPDTPSYMVVGSLPGDEPQTTVTGRAEPQLKLDESSQ